MSGTRRGFVALATILALLAAAAGCGIPADETAWNVTAPPPYRGFTTPPTDDIASGTATEVLYLTKDQRLVAVHRTVDALPSIDALLKDLADGPTKVEKDQGLTSALSGIAVVIGTELKDGQLEITLGDGLDGVTAGTKLLAIAQIVCTVDEREDVTSVVFARDGLRSEVPRGDGSTTGGPLTRQDYVNIIATP